MRKPWGQPRFLYGFAMPPLTFRQWLRWKIRKLTQFDGTPDA